MIEELALYLGFGCLAGVLSGLFGFGGGVVIVPFLIWFFSRQGFPQEWVMIMAVATSLATMIVTSVSAVYSHHRHSAVLWHTVFRLAPGILVGSVIGSIIAANLPPQWFKLIFALFLLYVAVRLLFGSNTDGVRTLTPKPWLFSLVGTVIGTVSSVLGIGGGVLIVPFLIRCRIPIRNAVAISSACGFPIAVAGTSIYVALGWHEVSLPGSIGYVYLPAFVGIILTSIPFAPLGVYLAHKLPTLKLHRIFALVVIFVGGKLLWQVLQPFLLAALIKGG